MLIELLFANVVLAKQLCVDYCDENGNPVQRDERAQLEPTKTNETESFGRRRIRIPQKEHQKPREKVRYPIENALESNLPSYFSDLPANTEHNFVFAAKEPANDILFGAEAGSKIKVVIRQNIKASPNLPTPVVGEVVAGKFKGATVFGEATLESDLKRVVVKFSSLSGVGFASTYTISGRAIDPQGRIGMEGQYHAEDWKYGIASFFSTGAAIAVDSQVERTQTITGTYSESPSAANAVKKGVAASLGKVAARLAERAANVPGFTEIEGPIYMTIVLDGVPRVNR